MIGTPGVQDIGPALGRLGFNRFNLLVSEVEYSFATHLSPALNKKLQFSERKWVSILESALNAAFHAGKGKK